MFSGGELKTILPGSAGSGPAVSGYALPCDPGSGSCLPEEPCDARAASCLPEDEYRPLSGAGSPPREGGHAGLRYASHFEEGIQAREKEQAAATEVAWALVVKAGETREVDEAIELLRTAGSLFQFAGAGMEAAACEGQLIKRAEEGGRKEVSSYLRAMRALSQEKPQEVRRHLSDLEPGSPERAAAEGIANAMESVQRLGPTYQAAQALVEARLQEEASKDVLEAADLEGRQQQFVQLFAAWKERVVSGEFSSTREILQEIVEEEPGLHRAVAYLQGQPFEASHEEVEGSIKALFTEEQGYLLASHLTLEDLAALESGGKQHALQAHVDWVRSNVNDGEWFAQECAAVAGAFKGSEARADAGALLAQVMPATDLMLDMAIPAAVGEFLGAKVIAAAAPRIAAMARLLPVGTRLQGWAFKAGLEATEAAAVSGGMLAYDAVHAKINNPAATLDAQQLLDGWKSLSVKLLFARMAHVPLRGLQQQMGRTKLFADKSGKMTIVAGGEAPALNLLGRSVHAVPDHLLQTAAFATGGMIAHRMAWEEAPPGYFNEWLNLMKFKLGGKLLHTASGGQVARATAKIKARPFMEASAGIAKRLGGGDAALADQLTDALYLSYVRGKVSGDALLSAGEHAGGERAGGKKTDSRQGDSIDAVLSINRVLSESGVAENEGRRLLFDGERIYSVEQEVADAYLAELAAQRDARARSPLGLPHFAMAMAGEGASSAPGAAGARGVGQAGSSVETSSVQMRAEPDASGAAQESADLGNIDKALHQARSSAYPDRLEAARVLSQSQDPRALEGLLVLESAETSLIRMLVARGLRHHDHPRAVQAQLRLLNDISSEVRLEAARSLAHLKDAAAVRVLMQHTEGRELIVAALAAEVLEQRFDPVAFDALLSLAGDVSPEVRQLAAFGLGNLFGLVGVEARRCGAALNTLLRLSTDPDSLTRVHVAASLGRSDDPRAHDALMRMREDKHPCVYDEAGISLRRQSERQEARASEGAPASRALDVPHPARTMAARIRAAVAHVRRESAEGARGFANRGIHPGNRPESQGFDFREYREVQPGEPVNRPRYVNGRLVQPVFQQTQAINNLILVDPSVVHGASEEEVQRTVGTISEMNLAQRDAVGLLIGNGKWGGYLKPSAKTTTTESVLKALMDRALDPSDSRGAVALLQQNLARQNLPRGSRVYLVADFSAERDLAGVSRVLQKFAANGVTVVPVQVGGTVMVPKPDLRLGHRHYDVAGYHHDHHPKVEQRRQELADFLGRHEGMIAKGEGVEADALARKLASPMKPEELKLLSDWKGIEEVTVPEQPMPPEVYRKFQEIIDHGSVADLYFLVNAAKVNGWGLVLDWVGAMIAKDQGRSSWELEELYRGNGAIKQGSVSPEMKVLWNDSYLDDTARAGRKELSERWGGNDVVAIQYFGWGPGLTEAWRALDASRRERAKAAEAKKPRLPEAPRLPPSGLESFLQSISEFFGRSEGVAARDGAVPRSGAAASEGNALIARQQENRLADTGATKSGSPGKGQVWMQFDRPLAGSHQYLALGLYGRFDPARGTYSEVPGYALNDLSTGGGAAVRGKVVDAAGVVDMPVPLGGRIVKQGGGRVGFELSSSVPRPDVMEMKLADFRKLAPGIYGDQYQLLTEGMPLESMPQEMQDLVRGVEQMRVRDAMAAIQRYVIEHFEYRAYDDVVEKPILAEKFAAAEKGRLRGPNEVLDFILQARGGKCSELSEVTLTLLRQAGIPTVKFLGFVAEGKKVDREAHAAAVAMLPTADGRMVAEPVETAVSFMEPGQEARVHSAAMPEMPAEQKAADLAQAEAPQVEAVEAEGDLAVVDREASAFEAASTAMASREEPAPLFIERLWQWHWEHASEPQRAAMSKAWEYYLYTVETKGMTFQGIPLPELMLTQQQYQRYQTPFVLPPQYWIERARARGVTSDELSRFQRIWEANNGR